jgi:similar to stage IV sporulation protein
MAGKLFDQVGGTIRVKLKGKNLEKVINMAMARGIFIWDIKKQGDDLNLKVRTSGFKALRNISDEHGFDLEVTEKQGLPFYRSIFTRRMGFFGGAAVFVLALYLLSAFVWFVNIEGNQEVPRSKILLVASRSGLYPGAAKWNFQRNGVEEALLNHIPQISYARIDIRGVKANIQVVEKILPQEDISGPCHIVAARDGIITEILVLDGQASKEEGDVVAQGDILISGIVFPEKSPWIVQEEEEEAQPYTVRARGEVKARVWYEGYGECRMRTERLVYSGQEASRIYLVTPWKEWRIKGRVKPGFSRFRSKTTRHIITTPPGQLGFYHVKDREQVAKIEVHSETEALRIARQQALKVLRKKTGQVRVNDSHLEVLSSPSDPVLRVKVAVEVVENIAVAQAIKE